MRRREEPIGESASLSGWQLRRNWLLPTACALVAAAGWIATRVASEPDAVFGWLGVWLGVTFGPLVLARNAFRLARPVAIRATQQALAVDGRSIPTDAIVEAKLVPRPSRHGDHLIELVLQGGETITLSTSLGAAMVIFDMLGINPGERRTSFTTVVPFGRRFLVLLAVVGLPLAVETFVAFREPMLAVLVTVLQIVPICALVALIAGLLRGKVVVGAEGFTRRWLFWRRFVPFTDVVAINGVRPFVNRYAIDTIVTLENGRRVRLRALEAPDTSEQRGAESRALFHTLQQAYARAEDAAKRAGPALPLLRRGARSAEEWRRSLDQLGGVVGGGYRVAALEPEALEAVLRAADGPVDARIGAAAALVRIGRDEHRTAVRVAAEACAEPKTRELFLGLLDARDDGEVDAVLARVAAKE